VAHGQAQQGIAGQGQWCKLGAGIGQTLPTHSLMLTSVTRSARLAYQLELQNLNWATF